MHMPNRNHATQLNKSTTYQIATRNSNAMVSNAEQGTIHQRKAKLRANSVMHITPHQSTYKQSGARRCIANRTTLAQTTRNHWAIKLKQRNVNTHTCIYRVYMCIRASIYQHVCTFIHMHMPNSKCAQQTRECKPHQRATMHHTVNVSEAAHSNRRHINARLSANSEHQHRPNAITDIKGKAQRCTSNRHTLDPRPSNHWKHPN